jgi:subtilase family serine protease
VSTQESEPGYQTSFGITSTSGKRGTPDVAYIADPGTQTNPTGVAVYDSYGTQTSWINVGGTSAGAPQWSGLIALVDQGRASLGKTQLSGYNSSTTNYALVGNSLYAAATGSNYAANYHDITTGSNGNPAGTGYDLATGLGTPIANNLISWLINY